MACKVEYKDNKPVRVLKENGKESSLFKKIMSHPMIEGFADALGLYKNVYSNEIKESINSLGEDADGKIKAVLNIAPYFKNDITDGGQVDKIRSSDSYKAFIDRVNEVGSIFNIKLTSSEDTIGGYAGNQEVSSLFSVEGNWENIRTFAAYMGVLTPEVQESTIASTYVESGSEFHNVDEYTVEVDNEIAALKAAKESGFNEGGFTLAKNKIIFLDFSKGVDKNFKNTLRDFERKFENYGGTIRSEQQRAIRSELIEAEDRKRYMGEAEREGLYQRQGGSRFSDVHREAVRRNEAFIAWQKLDQSEEARRYRELRSKQLSLPEGETLSPSENSEIKTLGALLSEPIKDMVKGDEQAFVKAKNYVETVADDIVKNFKEAFVSKFGIKRPSRASVKIVRWYDLQPNDIGDGARTNIIVNSNADADELFKQLRLRFEIKGVTRTENDNPTILGYPKRLIEIKTPSGKIGEIQVMTPEGYLAKDGVKAFPEDQQDSAQTALNTIRSKVGWDIPDGIGHYFYELHRDPNVPLDISSKAKELSLQYYGAFLNEDHVIADTFPEQMLSLIDRVDVADKSEWDDGNNPQVSEEAIAQLEGAEVQKIENDNRPAEDVIKLKNKVGDQVFDSYQEALQSRPERVQIVFETPDGEFHTLKVVDVSYDSKTKDGFINSYVADGILAGEQFVINGESYFKPGGGTEVARGVNDILIKEEAVVKLGWENFSQDDNGYKFEPRRLNDEELPAKDKLVQDEALRYFRSASNNNTVRNIKSKPTESELKSKLLETLNRMGVDNMAISDYLDKYADKNGVEPSAEALVDMANKIVAFKNGEITLDNLTEEVSHLIVEGWDRSAIENILRNIHQTEEYKQYAEHYRDIYSKKYSGEELDQLVRKEILGKVLANSFKNGFSTEGKTGIVQSIINKVRDLFNRFVGLIRGTSNTEVENQLKDFTDQVKNLVYQNQIDSYLNTENIKKGGYLMYSTGEESTPLKGMRAKILKSLKVQEDNLKILSDKIPTKLSLSNIKKYIRKVEDASDKFDESAKRNAVLKILAVSQTSAKFIHDNITEGKDAKAVFGAIEKATLDNLSLSLDPMMDSLKKTILDNPSDYPKSKWRDVVDQIDKTKLMVSEAVQAAKDSGRKLLVDEVNRVADMHNLGEDYKINFMRSLEAIQKDTSVFHKNFGQIVNSGDPVLGLMSALLEKTYNGANQEFYNTYKPIAKKIFDDLGLKPKHIAVLSDRGYMVAEQDEAAKEAFVERLRAESRLEVMGEKFDSKEELNKAIDDVIDKQHKGVLPNMPNTKYLDYQRVLRNKWEKYREKPLKEQYYQERENKYLDLKTSLTTQNLLLNYSADRHNVLRKVTDKDGTVDWTRLSDAEYNQLLRLKSERNFAKSLFNSENRLRPGIKVEKTEPTDGSKFYRKVNKDGSVDYYVLDNKAADDVKEDAETAIDINNLDQRFVEEQRNKEALKLAEIRKSVTSDPRSIQEIADSYLKGTLEPLTGLQQQEYDSRAKEQSLLNQQRFQREVELVENGIPQNSPSYTSLEDAMKNRGKDFEGFKVDGKDYVYYSYSKTGYKRVPTKQGKDAAMRFIKLNSTISENNEFFSKLAENANYLNAVQEAIDNLTDPDEIKRYSTALRKIKNYTFDRQQLLSRYKKPNSPFETDVDAMNPDTKRKIIDYESDISDNYAVLNGLKLEREEVTNPIYDLLPNQAYKDAVKDMSLAEELDFIRRNSTEKSKERIEKFKSNSKRFAAGDFSALTPFQEKFLKKYRGNLPDDDVMTVDFAKTQLASYYKKFTSKEKAAIEDNIEDMTASEYLQKLYSSEFVDVRPEYSFLNETDQDLKNPNYDNSFKGSFQAKRGMFESKKYKDLFAPDANGNPTKNHKLFQARQVLLNMMEQSLGNTDLEGRHNIYKLPQMTRRSLDAFVSTVKGNLKGGWKTLSTYRQDEKEYGESVRGTDVSRIPRYYFRDLKRPEDLTNQLMYSYTAMLQQSILYKYRKNNIGAALAMREAMESRQSDPTRKTDSKTAINMFDSYLKYGFYGQRESAHLNINVLGRPVDLTKLTRGTISAVTLRNIGFSFPIALTSWFDTELQYRIEQWVNEISNVHAATLASKEFLKQAGKAIAETGNINAKSKLNRLSEFFGYRDITNRLESSNFSWGARNLWKGGWAPVEASDFPIVPRAMLSVLFDYRLVDDSIMNFAQYKRKYEGVKPLKDIKEDWKQYDNKTIYNYLDTSNDQIRFSDGLRNELKNNPKFKGDVDSYLENKMEAVTGRIKRIASQINTLISQTQRTDSQRHYLRSAFTTHRSWLSIAISDRTKNAHYNTMTGEYEEGSYRTLLEVLNKGLVDFFGKGNRKAFKDLWLGKDLRSGDRIVDGSIMNFDAFKKHNSQLDEAEAKEKFEQYEEVTENAISFKRALQVRRRNLKRVAIDAGVIMGMAAITFALASIADDPDNKDNFLLQMYAYTLQRTLAERTTTSTALPTQVYEAIKTPFVGLGVVVDMLSLPLEIFNSDVINSGKYKGQTERSRALKKTIPGLKALSDLQTVYDTRRAYWHYNKNSVLYTSPAALVDMLYGYDFDDSKSN